MRRSVLAFIAHSVRLSVCLCLAPVVACGILYRLIPSVSSLVSPCRLVPRLVLFVLPNRLVSCLLIPFPSWGVSPCRLVPSVSQGVSLSCFLSHVSVSSLTSSVRLRSSPLVIIIVVVRVLPLLSPLSFSFSSSVSPRLASHVSSAFPYCVPLLRSPDVPYETADAHDVPLIYSLGRLPSTIAIGEQMGN